MTLESRKDDDGVVVISYRSSDGRVADVADFWIQPLIDRFGMTRSDALEWQSQLSEVLVYSFNRIFYSQIEKSISTEAQQAHEANIRG